MRPRTERDWSWPLYLLIAGAVIILLRYFDTGDSAIANHVQLLLGIGLMIYAVVMMLHPRRVP